MSAGKHRLAQPPQPQPQPRRNNRRRLAAVAAPLATAAIVTAGVALSELPQTATAFQSAAAKGKQANLSNAAARSLSTSALTGASRSAGISRSLDRLAVPLVTAQKWTTEDPDLRLAAGDHAKTDGELAAGKKVGVTGKTDGAFAEVVVDNQSRWVTAEYLADEKPVDPASMGLATTPCDGTSGVMRGLTSNMIRVYEAVCHNFPQITTYGGLANRPEHNTGRALDCMTNDPKVGYAIAAFLQAHAQELDLYDIIYRQHIWTPVRASEGWRAMPNRGSATANHMDHVHVGVN